MKLQPIIEKTVIFNDYDTNDTDFLETCMDSCDSFIAVLTKEQLDNWLAIFDKVVSQDDMGEYVEFGSRTMVFDIDGKLFTVVSDSGGEGSTGYFCAFCDENEIEHQFVIDSVNCEGIAVDEIYTGEYDNNLDLLTLLHKVYN